MSRSTKKTSDETPMAVLRALSVRPGAGPAQIVKMTGRSWGAVENSLHNLVREGRIRDAPVQAGHAYFLADSGGGSMLALRGAPLRFMDALHRLDGASPHEISRATGMDAAEVSKIGSRLCRAGLVACIRSRNRLYYMPAHPHRSHEPLGT